MEQTILSGPVGHTEWESEPPSPLRFVSLDTDKAGLLPQNTTGQTGLDFKTVDLGKAPPTNGDVFQENNFNLDLFRTPRSHGEHILQLKGDQPSDSKGDFLSIHQEQLPLTETPTLPWLFSPSPTDLLWGNSACEELNPTQDAPVSDTHAACSLGELIALSEPSSPVRSSDRTADTDNTEAASWLADLLSPCEHSPAPLTPELDPQGVSEELLLLSLGEEDTAGLPPTLVGEAVSPETGDKGLLLEPVTDLPMTGNMTPLGLPPSCLPHVTSVPANRTSTLSKVLEGPMPLLDVTDVPDCHSNLGLSLFPAGTTSLSCTDAPSPDTPAEKLEGENTLTTFPGNLPSENLAEGVLSPLCSLLISNSSTEPDTPAETLEGENTLTTFPGNLPSENLVEGVLSPLGSLLISNSSTEPSASTPRASSDGDASVLGESQSDCCSAENGEDLMAGSSVLSEPKHEAMALDQCLATGELHNEEKWDVTPPEGMPDDAVPDSQTGQSDGEVLMHLFGHSDCHETDTFDFPAQESSESSPEPGWTTEEAVDAVSLSKMVSDPMHMVSTTNQSDRDVSPLKAVFDALDQDGDGFVRIEEFMEFAAAYGADQVKDLTKFLDPSGLGVISFEDFHRGITAISNGGPEPQLYDAHYSPGDGAVGCAEEYDEVRSIMRHDTRRPHLMLASVSLLEDLSIYDDALYFTKNEFDLTQQNEVTDSAYLGSESTYSECETFTDEDTGALVPPEMHEEVETDSGIEATIHDADDGSNRFSLNSDLHNHSLVTVIGGEEEHFEDFGESNTSELLLETSMDGTEEDPSLLQTPDQVNGSSLLLSPSAPAPPLPDRFQSFLREEAQGGGFQSFLREEALDFFCSQCHKQISRLEDLSTRLNFLEMTSAGKRLSSKKVARHLLQNSSMTLDTVSDLTRDILELADNDITDKVLLLERRVAELEKESEASGEQRARLRQENLQLVHRANALDEQLKEQELSTEERLQNETRRHKDALHKMERERGLELENLQARLQQLDEENSELRSCVPCLRANIERLEEEKRKLQDETEDMTDRLNEEMEARRKMADKLSHERHQSQKEKESTQELIEDLRKQLEHLQLYKLEAETRRGRSPSAGLQEYQTRTREAELEQEIKRLKQDNRSLKEQNDELNGQIINLSIQGAKNLMSSSFSDSLAAEISSVSRGELMEAVHKQEEINYRLQDYIDKIIVAIMECNPAILEVK